MLFTPETDRLPPEPAAAEAASGGAEAAEAVVPMLEPTFVAANDWLTLMFVAEVPYDGLDAALLVVGIALVKVLGRFSELPWIADAEAALIPRLGAGV